jgi:AhpD family alkylhydroperoxidase
MPFDWNTYQTELTKSIPDFAKLSPDSLKGYQTLSAPNAKNSLLGEKVRQLIAIAVAVTTRCDGCITFHTDAALKAGATKQQIAEALGVAMAMNAGAALIYSLRALDSVDAHAHKPWQLVAAPAALSATLSCVPASSEHTAGRRRSKPAPIFLSSEFTTGRAPDRSRPRSAVKQRARQGEYKKC